MPLQKLTALPETLKLYLWGLLGGKGGKGEGPGLQIF